MTSNPSTEDHPGAGSGSLPDPEFSKLYVTGVVGWLLGMVALFGASWIFSKPETVPIAMLWMISHCWIAFLLGMVLLVIRGLVSKTPLAKTMLAYVLPVLVLTGIAGICLLIYPDAGFRGELVTYLPVVLVFYCFGCLWMALGGPDGGTFWRAVMPSLLGGLIILGFVAVPAFASDSFRYRAAFQLNTKGIKVQDGALVFEGDLEIMKAGCYEFAAPRYTLSVREETGGTDVEFGELQWGEAGAPKDGAIGKFPVRIVWKKSASQHNLRQLPPYDEGVMLEVRRPDQGGKLVYLISAKTETAQ
jgi:hypothetical protein